MAELEKALDLVRRMPPRYLHDHLSHLVKLRPDLMEELLETIDQPLKESTCPETGKKYILCDFNRDQDSFRSPHSNTYSPPLADGVLPSNNLRQLESEFNEVFSYYVRHLYEGGVSSVYLWDTDSESGFAGAILIHKVAEEKVSRGIENGMWDAIHVFEVTGDGAKAHIQLTSSIMLWLGAQKDGVPLDVSGNVTKQVERDVKINPKVGIRQHLVSIGALVEETEFRLLQSIDQVYFGKSGEILSDIHERTRASERKVKTDFAAELMNVMAGRKKWE